MKKVFLFILFIFVILCSSCQEVNTTNEELNNFVDKFLEYDEIYVIERTYIDSIEAVISTAHYEQKTDFNGYKEAVIKDGRLSKSGASKIYTLNDNTCVSTSENKYYVAYKPDSLYEFIGIENVLLDAKSKGKYSGSLEAYKITEVVSNIIYELSLNKTVSDLLKADKISYDIIINNANEMALNLDLTEVYKEIDSSITSADKTFILSQFSNYSFPEFPKGSPDNGTSDKVALAQEEGREYIKSRFENLDSIKDDFVLYPQYPSNVKVKYSYEVSEPSILDLNGNFNHPDVETNIIISVDLSYDGEVYDSMDFTVTALPEETYTGIKGSISNPLYNGRKPTDTMDVYFIEMVKQYGDSIYIKSGDFDMLIDAGQSDDAGNVRKVLREYVYDQTLECLIATHAHSDHIGGMTTALGVITNIDYVVDFGYDRAEYTTTAYYRNYINTNAEVYHSVYDIVNGVDGLSDRVYITNDIYIDFLDTNDYIRQGTDINGGDDNSASVVFILNFKGKKFYFSGDIGATQEDYLVSSGQLQDVDVMKATHHASSNGNTTSLLNKIKPEIVVVSAALVDSGSKTSNPSNQTHPSKQALNRFYQAGAKVYCNFTTGTIKVSTDGNTITLIGLGRSKPYYYNGSPVTGEENLEFKYSKWAQKFRP